MTLRTKLTKNQRKNMWVIASVMYCFGASVSYTQDFYKKHAEGWFWYQDPLLIEHEVKEQEKANEAPRTQQTKTPLNLAEKAHQQMETFKKQLEDLKVIALTHPTAHNVERYMHQQKEMLARSENFSTMWQQVVLSRPELNPEVTHPTAQFAKPILYDAKEQQKKQVISELSHTHGLIYFFKGNCSYCTGFAPIVKMFAEKYKWQVLAISLDGAPSEIFPDARPDNGIGSALKIQSVPALIALNAQTNDMIPISYAMTSLDQLETNFMALVGGDA